MGKSIVTGISIWLIIKGILNLILGFGFGNIAILVVSIIIAILLMSGVPYVNYVTAALLVIVFLKNLPYNLTNFQVLYLAEGMIDVVAAVLLVVNKNVIEHFKSETE